MRVATILLIMVSPARWNGHRAAGKKSRTLRTGIRQDSPLSTRLRQAKKNCRPGSDQRTAQISVAVDLVNLRPCHDKRGNIVTGLRPEHFVIYEDNVSRRSPIFRQSRPASPP